MLGDRGVYSANNLPTLAATSSPTPLNAKFHRDEADDFAAAFSAIERRQTARCDARIVIYERSRQQI